MKLSELAALAKKENILVKTAGDCEFSAMGFDSRCVEKNSLFFVKGNGFKEEFLVFAMKSGAVCYVAEREFNIECPHLIVSDIRGAMALFAKEFFGDPTSKFSLTGITGTKGKTSTAYMMKYIFSEFFGNERVGVVSTIEALCGDEKLPKSGTTPEALPLNVIFDTFAKKGIKSAIMEVSSQALQYDRVKYMSFLTGVYLNLSLDHQSPDEHSSFEEYKRSKMRLFSMCENAVINVDDKYAKEFIDSAKCSKIYTFAIDSPADFRAENIELRPDGAKFTVNGKYISGETFEINIAGKFNVYNALAAIVASYILGIDLESIKAGLKKTVIKGRMDIFSKKGITVITDYAHNGLALSQVLDYTDKFYPESRVTCLFGCPGGKAFDRRATLPETAGERSDFVVLTSDDPAFEEPEKIMDEMAETLDKTGVEYVKITDRVEAIRFALHRAEKGDVVILAGKGHETAQSVKGKSVEYPGDMQTAKAFFE